MYRQAVSVCFLHLYNVVICFALWYNKQEGGIMDKITVDSSLRVGCGKCVKDCVAFALYLENGKAKLRLPRGHKVVTCMIIGYPDVEYKRIAPRKPHKIKKI